MSRTLTTWLVLLLFVVVPALIHLLDGPSETEAAQDVATDVLDAQASAHAVALATAKLTQLGYQP